MPGHILIVEDDDSLRELLRLHLSNAGYEVTEAPDGIAAGYAFLARRPDLVISDVEMPHMNGFELVAALKGDKSIPDVPVIFLTSRADAADHGMRIGAVGYVTKPVRADVLLALVEQHCSRAQASAR